MDFERKKDKTPITIDTLASFFKDRGFEGDPQIRITVDTMSEKDDQGNPLSKDTKNFSSIEEALEFIDQNSDIIFDQLHLQKFGPEGVLQVEHSQELTDWIVSLPEEQKTQFHDDRRKLEYPWLKFEE